MERVVNVKHLLKELKNRIKTIIIAGTLLALLYTGLYCVNVVKQAETSQHYGTFAKLYITKSVESLNEEYGVAKIVINNDGEEVLTLHDNTEEIIALLESDNVLESVALDKSVKKADLSVEDIRDMLYIRGKNSGKVIEINTITDQEQISGIVCSKVVEYAKKYFINSGYRVEILQEATPQGNVSIEYKENENNPSEPHIIITNIESYETGISLLQVIKSGIVGFIVGIILGCIYLCIRFIIRDRIVYPDQIFDFTGLTVIGNGEDETSYWNVYSNMVFYKKKCDCISLFSVYPMKHGREYVFNFAEALGNANKKIIVVEYCTDNSEDYINIEKKECYDYATIYNKLIVNEEEFLKKLEELKRAYDGIVFMCDDIYKNPISKLISKHVDENVIIVEKDTIHARKLAEVKESFESAEVHIAGVVFIE